MKILHQSINQGLKYDNRSTKAFQDSVINEVSRLEEIPVGEIKSWISNINSDFFKYPKEGQEYILKILVSKPESTIITEYNNLVDLYSLSENFDFFTTPNPKRLLPEKSAYVSNYLKGLNLAELINDKNTDFDTLNELFYDAGKTLSIIHKHWDQGNAKIDIEDVIEDIKLNSPWKLTTKELSILSRLKEKLVGHEVPYVILYQDFDPVNVVYYESTIGLLDPPENNLNGPLHWDIASFIFGVKRAPWKRPFKLLLNNKEYEQVFISSFLDGYSNQGNINLDEADLILIDLFQVARLSQLWIWWKTPLMYRRKLFGIMRYIYAMPILKKNKNKLFQLLNVND